MSTSSPSRQVCLLLASQSATESLSVLLSEGLYPNSQRQEPVDLMNLLFFPMQTQVVEPATEVLDAPQLLHPEAAITSL